MNKIIQYSSIVLLLLLVGCTNHEKVPIYEHFFAPNSFSPNEDFHNECFRPIPIQGVVFQEFHITIYNEFLKEVYRSDDIFSCWNGTIGSEQAPEGSYNYQIIYTASEDSINFHDYITTSKVNLFR